MEFEKAKKFTLEESIDYVKGGVGSRQIIKSKEGNITVFAFAKGEGLSEHSAPYDALVQIIEGEAEVIIDKKSHDLKKGELIILPADIPHALNATDDFKMMLVMIKSKNQ